MNTAVKVMVGLLLILLLIGLVVTTFRFLIGAAIVFGLIVLALAGVSKWMEGREDQRIRVPAGGKTPLQDWKARRALKRLEKSVNNDKPA